MNNSKIELRIGSIDFSGEGEENWVASQLDKILEKVPALLEIAVTHDDAMTGTNNSSEPQSTSLSSSALKTSLPKFLKEKNATKSQLERFLATAEWLTQRGTKMMTTTDVTGALKKNHQPRLGNPSECLNQNVKKGFCEKDGKKFFVTPDGRESLS